MAGVLQQEFVEVIMEKAVSAHVQQEFVEVIICLDTSTRKFVQLI